MTDETATAATPESPGVLDLDAIPEESAQTVRIGGQEYPVRNPMDIPLVEIEEMLHIQEALAGKPWHAQLGLARRQVQILIPTLPEEVLNRLTGRQIVRIMVNIMGLVPLLTSPTPVASKPTNGV